MPRSDARQVYITPDMVKAGVVALREWLEEEDRYLGDDARAVRDVFLAMYELETGKSGRQDCASASESPSPTVSDLQGR